MDTSELTAAVDSILPNNTAESTFDPIDASTRKASLSSPLRFETPNPVAESSDEETRIFIQKYDGFVPKSSSTPRVKLRKTPRVRNAPTCTHLFKKGSKKGETCGAFTKMGELFCTRHRLGDKTPNAINYDFEHIAVKAKFYRLKVSKKYKLIQYKEPTAILEDRGRLLKVRLPKLLRPIPKTGSYLKFEKTGQGRQAKVMWECV